MFGLLAYRMIKKAAEATPDGTVRIHPPKSFRERLM